METRHPEEDETGASPSKLGISVIVPAYNKREYLLECLRSIQVLRFANRECIVLGHRLL